MYVSGSHLITASLLTWALSGCNDVKSDLIEAQREISSKSFSSDVEEFEIRVFYESGATPRVGAIYPEGPQTWDISEESLTALFQTHLFNDLPRIITVPKLLEEMNEFVDQDRETWSTKQLIELSDYLFEDWNQNSLVVIPVIFLNGSYRDNKNILGLHLIGRPHTFIFQDNIPNGQSFIQKYAEQSIVVHELGHAVGVVNAGVPMVKKHEDTLHIGHSKNTNCVMHFAVDLKVGIFSIVRNFINNKSLNLFGQETLNDAHSFHP